MSTLSLVFWLRVCQLPPHPHYCAFSIVPVEQCWRSVTFWYGYGSSDPYLRLTDPDADPGCPKTYGSGTLVKSQKEVTKQKKSRFFLSIFAWWWKDPEPYLGLTDPYADLDPQHCFWDSFLNFFICLLVPGDGSWAGSDRHSVPGQIR